MMKMKSIGHRMARSLAALCLGGAALLGAVGANAVPTFSNPTAFAGDLVTFTLTEADPSLTLSGGITFQLSYEDGTGSVAPFTLQSITVPNDGNAMVLFPDLLDSTLPPFASGDGVSIALGDLIDPIELLFAPSESYPLIVSLNFLIAPSASSGVYFVGFSCTDIFDEVTNPNGICKSEDYQPNGTGTITVSQRTQTNDVPEPASLALLAGGLLGLAAVSRRRQRKL